MDAACSPRALLLAGVVLSRGKGVEHRSERGPHGRVAHRRRTHDRGLRPVAPQAEGLQDPQYAPLPPCASSVVRREGYAVVSPCHNSHTMYPA